MNNKIDEIFATTFGFEEVVLSQKNKDGQPIIVRVAQLPIRRFPELAMYMDVEPKMIELFTGLTPEEIDELSEADFLRILEVGEMLNHAPFSRWLNRKTERAAKMNKSIGLSMFGNHGTTPSPDL
jgi:hypothetical protein